MRYDIEAAMLASERAARILHRKMGRGRTTLTAIASTASFIGILATVQEFVIALRMPEPPSWCDCSGALSEGLVTTAIGLFVAVMALWCDWYLGRKLESVDTEMRAATLELANFFSLGHRH